MMWNLVLNIQINNQPDDRGRLPARRTVSGTPPLNGRSVRITSV